MPRCVRPKRKKAKQMLFSGTPKIMLILSLLVAAGCQTQPKTQTTEITDLVLQLRAIDCQTWLKQMSYSAKQDSAETVREISERNLQIEAHCKTADKFMDQKK